MIEPEAGGAMPISVLSSVDLPAPLRPSSATISWLCTSKATSDQDVALAVEGVHALEAASSVAGSAALSRGFAASVTAPEPI